MKRQIQQQESRAGMSESSVQVMVYRAFEEYEEKTGLPRHKENLENAEEFKKEVNQGLRELRDYVTQGIVVIKTLRWLLGVPPIAVAIIYLVRSIRGH